MMASDRYLIESTEDLKRELEISDRLLALRDASIKHDESISRLSKILRGEKA